MVHVIVETLSMINPWSLPGALHQFMSPFYLQSILVDRECNSANEKASPIDVKGSYDTYEEMSLQRCQPIKRDGHVRDIGAGRERVSIVLKYDQRLKVEPALEPTLETALEGQLGDPAVTSFLL